jgi:hypothetical protein
VVVIGLHAGDLDRKRRVQIGKPEIKVVKARTDALQQAPDPYRIDIGHHPRTERGLPARMARPGDPLRA